MLFNSNPNRPFRAFSEQGVDRCVCANRLPSSPSSPRAPKLRKSIIITEFPSAHPSGVDPLKCTAGITRCPLCPSAVKPAASPSNIEASRALVLTKSLLPLLVSQIKNEAHPEPPCCSYRVTLPKPKVVSIRYGMEPGSCSAARVPPGGVRRGVERDVHGGLREEMREELLTLTRIRDETEHAEHDP